MQHRPARHQPTPLDWSIAAGFAVCVVLGTIGASTLQHGRLRPLDVWGVLLIVAASLASVALRRDAPLWALTATMVIVSAYLLADYPLGPVQLCMIISMFEVARLRSARASLLACGLAAAAASATLLLRMLGAIGSPALLALAWAAWIVLPWSLGSVVHLRAAARERQRSDLVARIAIEERMKIAGEVHDVAGHGFALVAMQAGVALLVFDEKPEQVRTSLEAIQATSAKSLTALRGMLDAVHPGEPSAGPVTEDVGLAGLGELLDQVRAGGLPVRLELENLDEDFSGALDADVDAVSYRVVQESLTNVLRHAGPTRAEIRIARSGSELLVCVLDNGLGCAATQAAGRGLTGMRNRVEEVGGRLEVGPRDEGGFAVRAWLPLSEGTNR